MKALIVFFCITTSLFGIERDQVPEEARWNVKSLYADFDAWHREFTEIQKDPLLAQATQYRGRLAESPRFLLETIVNYNAVIRKLEKLQCYAMLRRDENLRNDEAKQAFGMISSLMNDFQQTTAWIEPEILSLDEARLKEFLQEDELQPYHFFLERLSRSKSHILDSQGEELIALASETFTAPAKAFRAIHDADFHFDTVFDGAGNPYPLTHASYSSALESTDRTLRKNCFSAYYTKYLGFQNTLCELLSGHVQSHVFNAKARKFPSSLDAALWHKNISAYAYHTLINTVHERIDLLHRYIALRKKALGLDELHSYDLSTPLVPSFDRRYSFDEAVAIILEAVKPLGNEYVAVLKKGLTEDRWVDRYENANKRSGAYSSGSYDSMPFILMSFEGTLHSLLTLAHEAGHSMHSYFSRKYQPYQYAYYDLFVAEVASLFNEELIFQYLLKKAQTKEEKAYILSQALDRIRSAVFRQVSFAEFELFIHSQVENSILLTPKMLCDKYRDLIKFYYGPALTTDPEIDIEWARVPHFYFNFYVFQYATGMSAALCLNKKVLTEGEEAREDYLAFLRSGGSDYPLALLAKAGVDMCSPEPIHKAMDHFEHYLTELESLLLKTTV